MLLLDTFTIGGAEIGIILAILAVPALLILYSVVDILRSEFKTGLMKYVFLALVLFAPLLGSIIYLIIRKDYLKPNDPGNTPMV